MEDDCYITHYTVFVLKLNNANFDGVSSNEANMLTLMRNNFLTHILKLIIFGRQNLQTLVLRSQASVCDDTTDVLCCEREMGEGKIRERAMNWSVFQSMKTSNWNSRLHQ